MCGDQSLWPDRDDDRVIDGESERRGEEERVERADRAANREYGNLHPGSRIGADTVRSERRTLHCGRRSGEGVLWKSGVYGGEIHSEPARRRRRRETLSDGRCVPVSIGWED